MKVEKGLLYTKDHEWVKVDGNKAYVGITDYAQDSLGDIVYVELPEVGEQIGKDEVFGVVESVKAASDLYLPVSGTILEVNESVLDDPALINEDAYENWMILIEMDDPDELDELLSASEYEEICVS